MIKTFNNLPPIILLIASSQRWRPQLAPSITVKLASIYMKDRFVGGVTDFSGGGLLGLSVTRSYRTTDGKKTSLHLLPNGCCVPSILSARIQTHHFNRQKAVVSRNAKTGYATFHVRGQLCFLLFICHMDVLL